ncbi:glycosyltransferase [Flavobacterium sp. MAHUQ-51]|uniref:glycosyltransferase n=1 Tax=Flavobacterium sp. GCM10022190 TaxID=3252639 RepID=UPI0036112ED5
MPKKNLLFISASLYCGGAEKALISLLQSINYSKYNVDLFLFKHEGDFFADIPKEVKLLPEPTNTRFFDQSSIRALFLAIRQLNFKVFFAKMMHVYVYKRHKNGSIAEQYFWKYYQFCFKSIRKKYDVAIGFQEKNPIYFCVDKVKAKRKMGWIHTDLEKLQIDFKNEEYYFNALDNIVTVSDGLTERLRIKTPQFSNKICTIENIISSKVIFELASEQISLNFDSNYFNIIYVGRIAQEKGLFLGLEALNILIKKGCKVRWYLIGEGNKKEELLEEASDKDILENIFFLGLRNNPHPYVSKADCFLLPSYYEGKSISLEEAKILSKPIVVTNFSSAKDQIEDGYTGLIADMNPASIAVKLEQLIDDIDLRKGLIESLKNSVKGTEEEVSKFYDLINDEKC